MRKILAIGVAIATLGFALSPVAANDEAKGAVVGGTTGALTGGTVGFIVGGPVGAVVGGIAGSFVGGAVGISAASIDFAANHPVDEIVIEGDIRMGDRVAENVTIHAIDGDDRFGYIYANGRAYIVELDTRVIVESPGYLVRGEG